MREAGNNDVTVTVAAGADHSFHGLPSGHDARIFARQINPAWERVLSERAPR
jgi:hypothetical protein